MALPITTRILRFSRNLTLRITYQSNGDGERNVRDWIDSSAARAGAGLRDALAGASSYQSGTLSNSIASDYGFPALFVGTQIRYAQYQRNLREALRQGIDIVDREFLTRTRSIPFVLRYTGRWIIHIAGLTLFHKVRGTIRTSQCVSFKDLYGGYEIHETIPLGATFRFQVPTITVNIRGRPRL